MKHYDGIRVHSRDLWPRSAVCEDYAAALGSVSDGSLFLTLPIRALTGQQIISSAG
jgi:hypothetical protein